MSRQTLMLKTGSLPLVKICVLQICWKLLQENLMFKDLRLTGQLSVGMQIFVVQKAEKNGSTMLSVEQSGISATNQSKKDILLIPIAFCSHAHAKVWLFSCLKVSMLTKTQPATLCIMTEYIIISVLVE